MDNYLVDRETLGQFVDALIQKKFPNQPATDFVNLKEDAIGALDARITDAIFRDLNDSQLSELNQLLDNEAASESDFAGFFEKSGINLEQKITNVFENFKAAFLGESNV